MMTVLVKGLGRNLTEQENKTIHWLGDTDYETRGGLLDLFKEFSNGGTKIIDVIKTIAIDTTHSVFDNDTVAIMYISKDIYSDSYIVAIPVITFSWEIRNYDDYYDLLKANVFGDKDKRERLISAIKDGIAEFQV